MLVSTVAGRTRGGPHDPARGTLVDSSARPVKTPDGAAEIPADPLWALDQVDRSRLVAGQSPRSSKSAFRRKTTSGNDTNTPTLQHFIDGERVSGKSNRFGEVYDPATGRVQALVPFATAGEVGETVRAAKAAFSARAATPPSQRAHPVPLPRRPRSAPRGAGPHLLLRTRQDPRRRPRIGHPRHRDRRVRARDPPAPPDCTR